MLKLNKHQIGILFFFVLANDVYIAYIMTDNLELEIYKCIELTRCLQ